MRCWCPQPSYPLFEHLTRLEGVRPVSYRLDYHGRWEIDSTPSGGALVHAGADSRVAQQPDRFVRLGALSWRHAGDACRSRGWALIVDEVFADYPLEIERPLTDIAARADVLAFTLGGASKMLGLPQVKLGWMIVGGPQR